MWIVTTRGFLSLVQDRKNSKMLQVRARVRRDIEDHFPSAMVYAHNGADYRYRARISKEKVALVLADMVLNELTYTGHFKDVALAKDPGNSTRRSAYYGTWTAMAGMQDYAPYSYLSRAEVAKLPPVKKQTGYPYPGVAGTGTYSYRSGGSANVALPTFKEAQSLPGNPWRGSVPSAVDREELARESEVWADDDFPDDDDFDDDDFEGWPRGGRDIDLATEAELELEAVEEAFGVNTDTLSAEDLQDFLSQLSDLKYRENQPRRRTGSQRRHGGRRNRKRR